MTIRFRHYLAGLFPLNKALKILLVTNSLVLTAIAMLVPIWAIFIEQIGGSIIETGLATGLFAITAGIVVIASGKLSDEVRQSELIMALGYLILGVAFFSYIFVSEIWMLILVQILAGIGIAIYDPAFDAVYSKHLQKEAAGREWGVWEGINYFSQAGGATIGAIIAAFWGFDILFGVMGILTIASAAYVYFLPRRIL